MNLRFRKKINFKKYDTDLEKYFQPGESNFLILKVASKIKKVLIASPVIFLEMQKFGSFVKLAKYLFVFSLIWDIKAKHKQLIYFLFKLNKCPL